MKKLFLVCILLCIAAVISSVTGYATSTNTPDAAPDFKSIHSDLSAFAELRQAVSEKDISGVQDFSQYFELKGFSATILPDSIESANELLSLFDETSKTILLLDGSSSDVVKEFEVSLRSHIVVASYYLPGWEVTHNRTRSSRPSPFLEGRTDVAFTWETVDGDEAQFFPTGNGYAGQFSDSQGYVLVFVRWKDGSVGDLPPIEQFGALDVKTFTELTSKTGNDFLVWIALSGAAVVIGGAVVTAALIVRKRRRKAADAECTCI